MRSDAPAKKNKIGQQEIADSLDLSICTVAKVLNHDPAFRISEETRRRILKAAREMHYVPRRRRTGNIALLVCGELTELHGELCKEAARNGYRVFMVHKGIMPSYREVSLMINPLSADGVVIEGEFSPELAQQFGEIMPTIIASSHINPPGIDRVYEDAKTLGYQQAEYLISNGHTDIAIILGSLSAGIWQLALEGYREAMKNAGMTPDETMIWEKDLRFYPEIISEIVNHQPKPTALLAWTSADHAIILSTLMAMGYNVPQDLSYVGMECTESRPLKAFPKIINPAGLSLSLVKTIMSRLLERMEDRDLPVEVFGVTVPLCDGGTCLKRA